MSDELLGHSARRGFPAAAETDQSGLRVNGRHHQLGSSGTGTRPVTVAGQEAQPPRIYYLNKPQGYISNRPARATVMICYRRGFPESSTAD